MFRALVIDEFSLLELDSAFVEESWFSEFEIPKNADGLRRVVRGDTVYILSERAEIDSGYLVAKLGNDGVFSTKAKQRSVFERLLRVALSQFDRAISIPVQWQKFHSGSRVSVFAETYIRGDSSRICFDRSPCGDPNIFAFTASEKAFDLEHFSIDLECYQNARDGILEALVAPITEPMEAGHFGIVLSNPLTTGRATAGSLAEWQKRLNSEQLLFVNKPTTGPIRLRGAAGTGKTQAMAIKCLQDLYGGARKDPEFRVAFLTHSSALAHEVVRGMFYGLDSSEQWFNLKTNDGRASLWTGTLYEFAQQQLDYEKKGLVPLSTDGGEGRELQKLMIHDAAKQCTHDPRIALGPLRESPRLAQRINADDPTLLDDLMNEIACILDAENIKRGSPEAERYIKGSREPWQMELSSEPERSLVLELYWLYRIFLSQGRYLSMDQMIADLGRYLSTHEWEHLRERDGFDLIFVDEYHYFTKLEAMCFQALFKTRACVNGKWPLIMAYDLKQSARDSGLGGGLSRFKNPGVGESEPVDLTLVYRSTPQISAFLRDLDGSFPAMDLEGEYRTYAGCSARSEGPTPACRVFKTNTQMLDLIFEQATARVRGLNGRGGEVAVLCQNEDFFNLYRNAGRIAGKAVTITSREDLRELRYAKNRVILSMPEYVAGLQFDSVFLINCDDADLSIEHLSSGARRRYVSRMYLGASRATQNLVLAASEERGGLCSILNVAIDQRTLAVG